MSDRKVLVVDDEPAIRTLLRSAISAPGFTVFEADSGAAALLLARQQGPFSVVVSDVLMPGMDGIELATKLARAGQADRFLFISGYCDGDYIPERTRELPVAAFLGKPFSIPELLRSVRDVMEQQPAAPRAASVREKRAPTALRRPAAPIDAIRTLRRRTQRLQRRREALLDDARWGLQTHAALWAQVRAQYVAIEGIERTIRTRRAML